MIKRIIKICSVILTLILITFTILILIEGISARKENRMPRIFGYSYGVVPTPSMVPTINIGDYIIVKNIDYHEIQIGDIVVYYSSKENKNIVHRVVEIRDSGELEVKGDNNPTSDKELVNPDNYIGVVVQYGPSLFSVVIIQYRSLLYGIIIILFVFILISESFNIIKTIEETKREEEEKHQKQVLEQMLQAKREAMKAELLKELSENQEQKEK